MSKFHINGYECDFPSIPFDTLKAYEPTTRTYIVAGRAKEPVGRLFIRALVDEGIRVGALERVLPVELGERVVFLMEFTSQEWRDHFEFFLRIECGPDRWAVINPWRVWLSNGITCDRREHEQIVWRMENYIHSLGVEPYKEWLRCGRDMDAAQRIISDFRAKCAKGGVQCGC